MVFPCFVMQYLVSFLVFSLRERERERERKREKCVGCYFAVNVIC